MKISDTVDDHVPARSLDLRTLVRRTLRLSLRAAPDRQEHAGPADLPGRGRLRPAGGRHLSATEHPPGVPAPDARPWSTAGRGRSTRSRSVRLCSTRCICSSSGTARCASCLTGSSARKLRRGGANLLAGRARVARLHPLVSAEEAGAERLLDRINHGGLPAFLDARRAAGRPSDVRRDLPEGGGAGGRADSLDRQLRPLSRRGGADQRRAGQLHAKVASDTGLAPSTVREHYRILEDTLRRRSASGVSAAPAPASRWRRPSFYFFDVGVANTLRRTGVIEPGSDAYGRALEHLVFLEVRSMARLSYRRDDPLTYWRSRSQLEVDLVIGDAVAIEVNAKSRVSARDLQAACSPLPRRSRSERKVVVCHEPRRRRDDRGGRDRAGASRSCKSCGTARSSSDTDCRRFEAPTGDTALRHDDWSSTGPGESLCSKSPRERFNDRAPARNWSTEVECPDSLRTPQGRTLEPPLVRKRGVLVHRRRRAQEPGRGGVHPGRKGSRGAAESLASGASDV